MNNWKEHAHLFANGKFDIETDQSFSSVLDWLYNDGYDEDNPRLIARKIENLSDEEAESITGASPRNARSYLHDGTLNGGMLSGRYLLRLLEIGVYPFDQYHFESGEVIDVKKLEGKL